MPLDINAFGKSVRYFRKKRGYSQSYLSELIEKSPTYLSYVESGQRCISLDTLVDLANALNITADNLLMDSLESTSVMMNNEFAAALGDCSDYERRVLLDVLVSVKAGIRSNRIQLYHGDP